MAYLPSNFPSPAIASGVIFWCHDDEFIITVTLELKDNNGDDVILTNGDIVTITFYKPNGSNIKTFTFSHFPENNKIDLEFDAITTALFPQGCYLYDVIIEPATGGRFTIASQNKVEVK